MDANPATRAASEAMLRNGQVPMTRLTLWRVGYDDKFQAALLKENARHKALPASEDVEEFEEDEEDA